jgi:hypothetical protein
VQLWTRVPRDALRSTTRHPPQAPPRCRCCDTCSGVAIVRPVKNLPPSATAADWAGAPSAAEYSGSRLSAAAAFVRKFAPRRRWTGCGEDWWQRLRAASKRGSPAHPAGTCTRLKGALQLTLSSPAAHCVAPFQALPSHVCRPGLPARLRDGRSVCARAACSFAPPSPPPSLAPRLTALATSQPFPPRLDSGAARQGAERRAATVLCGAVVAEAR